MWAIITYSPQMGYRLDTRTFSQNVKVGLRPTRHIHEYQRAPLPLYVHYSSPILTTARTRRRMLFTSWSRRACSRRAWSDTAVILNRSPIEANSAIPLHSSLWKGQSFLWQIKAVIKKIISTHKIAKPDSLSRSTTLYFCIPHIQAAVYAAVYPSKTGRLCAPLWPRGRWVLPLALWSLLANVWWHTGPYRRQHPPSGNRERPF